MDFPLTKHVHQLAQEQIERIHVPLYLKSDTHEKSEPLRERITN